MDCAGSYRLIVRDGDQRRNLAALRRRLGRPGGRRSNAGHGQRRCADRSGARAGARARVQIRPPYAGEAQIVVATDRVIETRTVHVDSDGATIDLPVTAEWGSGAYVLVTVMTPRDPVNLPVPRRAVGVAYVPVDMGERTLQVEAGARPAERAAAHAHRSAGARHQCAGRRARARRDRHGR